MTSGTQARADRRALISAALIASGAALALGAMVVAPASTAISNHARAEREARLADASDAALMLAEDSAQAAIGRQVAAHAAKRASDLDCLTDAVYYEARGESKLGQQAVAQVVLNRSRNPNFPHSVCGVVFQRANGVCQFSFACDGSMHRAREGEAWADARRVAARALSGYVLHDVGSATHFHTIDVSPAWGPRMLRVAQVGLHVFYRFNPHAAAAPAEAQTAVFTSQPATEAKDAPQLRLAAAILQTPADPSAPAEPAKDKPAAKPATAEAKAADGAAS